MSVVRREARRRWLTVGGAVLGLCALPVLIAAWPVPPPGIDPATLRDRVLASADQPYQGYAESHGHLGIPDLSELGAVRGLLTGTTRIRSWYAGPDAWRVATLSTTGEADEYRVPGSTYHWDFEYDFLVRILDDVAVRLPRPSDLLPPELARRLLRSAVAGDSVTSIAARRVAGRTAAGLRLHPSDPDTTVDRVDIWADPRTGLPLRVEIAAAAHGRPVFSTAFLEVALRPPAAGVLAVPRSGTADFATTTSRDLAELTEVFQDALPPPTLVGRARSTPAPNVSGVGWYGAGFGSFVAVSLPGRLGYEWAQAARKAGGLDVGLPADVHGEVVEVRSELLTAIVVRTDDPRPLRRSYVLAGLVTPQLLRPAAIELLRGLP
ncbi:MAG TPA: hypothetical protein VKG85_00555 [Actinomycetes bacterium]|nr:hypothetical protein [Actinomycetes bacterium]